MASRRRRHSARNAEAIPQEQISRTLGYIRARYGPAETGFTLTVEILRERNATVARVTAPWDETAAGSAKRAPRDPYDPEIGEALAVGRALSKLGALMQARGNQLVTNANHAQRIAISGKIKHAARTAQERNFPQHHYLSTAQVRENYGEEAAIRHEARLIARRNNTSWKTEQEILLRKITEHRQERTEVRERLSSIPDSIPPGTAAVLRRNQEPPEQPQPNAGAAAPAGSQ